MVDSGYVDSSSNKLYDLNIVSKYKIYAPTDCALFFAGFNEVDSINFNNNFDTSNVTNMSYMFTPIYYPYNSHNWSALTYNVSLYNEVRPTLLNYDISSNRNIELMAGEPIDGDFYESKLINISSFDTSKVISMNGMFEGGIFVSLDLSNFDTSKVGYMRAMFRECSNLTTTIKIMKSKDISYDNIFYKAATGEGAKITVNYVESASNLVDSKIATKSTNSNVVKGEIIK